MCGITGFIGMGDKTLLKKMCDVIEHRGPDDWGIFLDRNVGLGARRLSIIDIKGGHQPVHNENKDVWIVFNGEIYNFPELKKTVEKNGHRFYTNCDTEAIVHLYEIFGENCVKYLRGMFAFAIWDYNKKTLFLARDRLGKKPLYYTAFGGKLLFSSEIKSILQFQEVKREVDIQALHEFLTLQYVPGPRTMFKDVWKLQPGHTLTAGKGVFQVKKYWDFNVSEEYRDEQFCKQKLINLLGEAVKIRMVSEVPIGIYLSGGIDSSAVTAFMSKFSEAPVNTFTVGFGHKTDEYGYAKIIADRFKTDHKEILVEPKNFNILPEVVWHFDEPVADPAAIPTYLMSKESKKYATVALVGEGGDEVFGGYEKYQIMMKLYRKKLFKPIYNRVVLSSAAFGLGLVNKSKKIQFISEFSKSLKEPSEAFLRLSALGFTESEKKQLYAESLSGQNFETPAIKQYFSGKSVFKNMLSYDMGVWLPDRLLMKVDKMTMASSVEARAPFMDHVLVEFSNKLDASLRLDKNILKKSLTGILPKEILKRKKHGFAVPIGDWFKEDMRAFAQNILDRLHLEEYFRREEVEKIVKDSQRVRNDHKLWNLINFEIWHKMFIENDTVGNHAKKHLF